ncbi:MAG: RNA methyltransferase [Actinomycetota bacterium]|nr:RNA methyltransferase [Actinomycetota bacterium]
MRESRAQLADSNARIAAARRLTRPAGRREVGLFLAEGAQAVREALRSSDVVVDVFATAEAFERHHDLLAGVQVDLISQRSAAALSETVTPQGLVAVCRMIDVSLDVALAKRPDLVVALIDSNDPGNAGSILRTGDAAGAQVVVLAGGVDIYNGKAVRATAGSLFHLDVVLTADPASLVSTARAAGFAVLATAGAGRRDLDDLVSSGALARPTLWLFGNEAHGLPGGLLHAADDSVRVPIHGRAESLNLAAAAAVCLYASARALRIRDAVEPGEAVHINSAQVNPAHVNPVKPSS